MNSEIVKSIEENATLLKSRATRSVVKVTVSQFVEMVSNNAGSSGFVTAYNVTEFGFDKGQRAPVKKHRKTKEPTADLYDWPITKGYTINFNLYGDYDRIVNAQREREGIEGNFERQEHSFIRRFDGKAGKFFGHHKNDEGRVYLCVTKPESIGDPIYIDAKGKVIEGETLTDLLENVLPVKSKSKKQGTEKEIIHLNPKIENIHFFVMNKVVYEIMH